MHDIVLGLRYKSTYLYFVFYTTNAPNVRCNRCFHVAPEIRGGKSSDSGRQGAKLSKVGSSSGKLAQGLADPLINYPILSMGLVYLPTLSCFFHGKIW